MRFIFFPFLFLLTVGSLWAQPKQNSPYSRFGIGDLLPQYFASQAGMGGQTAAYHDPYHVNLSNPASYAFLRTTALETALYGKFSHYKSSTSTLDNWSGNLAYLALGFTLKSPINEVLDKDKSPRRLGMGFSLTPYSLVGYNIVTQDTLSSGPVENLFLGNGGMYKMTWSSAIRYKQSAFGVNLGWAFGKAKYETEANFEDSFNPTLGSFRSNIRQDLGINGFLWNVGAQHDFVLKYDARDRETATELITVGLSAEGQHGLRISSDELFVRSRRRLGTGQFDQPDTLRYEGNVKKSLTLPASVTLGAMYSSTKWKLGAQLGFTGWSAYKNEARPETLRNTFSASAGLEYTPDVISYNRYLKRVRYRAGVYYRQDPRLIRVGSTDQELNDLGMTFGLGFPLILPRQQTSFVNTAFELGRLGANTAIEETYYRITLGFTLNDNTWFYKRRFE
ncbi:MAG TPA: hypothetical protein PK971_14465 [Saprospiraceae bacterium]|nr:hypothetical protein [Saprospiraceae bacterium]